MVSERRKEGRKEGGRERSARLHPPECPRSSPKGFYKLFFSVGYVITRILIIVAVERCWDVFLLLLSCSSLGGEGEGRGERMRDLEDLVHRRRRRHPAWRVAVPILAKMEAERRRRRKSDNLLLEDGGGLASRRRGGDEDLR